MAAEHRNDEAASDKDASASASASEERTEPFTLPDIHAPGVTYLRAEARRTEGRLESAHHVPLDVLQIPEDHRRQGVRILVRHLTSSTDTGARLATPEMDNCQWLVLRAAQVSASEQPEHKVLAVTQTSKDIKFSVHVPGGSQDYFLRPPLWCELYYDPASDEVIFLNRSNVYITLTKASQAPGDQSPIPIQSHTIGPGAIRPLQPGSWRINISNVPVLDFRILEKRPVTLYHAQPVSTHESSPSLPSNPNPSIKRALSPDVDEKRAKRRASESSRREDDGVIMFLGPAANPLVFPLLNGRNTKELCAANGHALLDNEEGDTVVIPGVCEVQEYQLTKRDAIASTKLSAVYTAEHSNIPDKIMTVKVLKTRVANAHGNFPPSYERSVIQQANMWLRESQSQGDLRHDSIVRFYGGDARFLSLYMEHVDASDLATTDRWRDRPTDYFTGTRDDAWRILRDISSALSYLHSRHLVHNDIKPGNILYSRDRGAVLCDFGLSTPVANPPSSGGTPFYIPPEFIGTKARGPASDVWALGITLLYALRKIPLPDSRGRKGHPKPLYWQIGVVNTNTPHAAQPRYGNGSPAASQMRDWLVEVFEARESLASSQQDPLERVVGEMLTPNPQHRISMKDILRELM